MWSLRTRINRINRLTRDIAKSTYTTALVSCHEHDCTVYSRGHSVKEMEAKGSLSANQFPNNYLSGPALRTLINISVLSTLQ